MLYFVIVQIRIFVIIVIYIQTNCSVSRFTRAGCRHLAVTGKRKRIEKYPSSRLLLLKTSD